MSQRNGQRNGEGKRTARERMQEERERQRTIEKRMRLLKVAAVVVVVLAVTGVAGVLATKETQEESGPSAKPITEGKAEAPATLTVYEDFRCPGCGHFEQNFKDTIHELRDAGKIKTEYYLVSIIDGNMGGNGSKYAANAAACARDAGKFTPYHDALYANQPEEAHDAFADKEHLIELAGKVKGLDSAEFRSCVKDGSHDAWVKRTNDDFTSSEYNSTPTVLLNGEDIYSDQNNPLTPEKLTNLVEELV